MEYIKMSQRFYKKHKMSVLKDGNVYRFESLEVTKRKAAEALYKQLVDAVKSVNPSVTIIDLEDKL